MFDLSARQNLLKTGLDDFNVTIRWDGFSRENKLAREVKFTAIVCVICPKFGRMAVNGMCNSLVLDL